MGRAEELRAEFQAAQEPAERLRVLKLLAAALESEGNVVDARRAWESATRFAPGDLEAVRGLRLCVAAHGQPAEALPLFQRELALTPEAERGLFYKSLGEHFQNRLNDFENAQTAFARARQFDANVFSPATAPAPEGSDLDFLDVPPPPGAAVEAPPEQGAPAVSPVEAHSTQPTPQEVRRPSARRPSRVISQRPLIIGMVLLLVVVAGVSFRNSAEKKEVAPKGGSASVVCAGDLKTVAPHQEGNVKVEVIECVRGFTSHRYTLHDGRIVEESELAGGVLEGQSIELPTPEERIEGSYVRGLKSGPWTTTRAGVVTRVQNWSIGQRHGEERVFASDSGFTEVVVWRSDLQNGNYSHVDDAGVVRLSGAFMDGKKVGTWQTFDVHGRLVDRWQESLSDKVDLSKFVDVGYFEKDGVRLYGGRSFSWWKMRLAEFTLLVKNDQTQLPLRTLMLDRAVSAGLVVDEAGELQELP